MNNPKLKVINGHAYTTSVVVASYFGKRHDNVVRDIENLISLSKSGQREDFALLNFEETSYKDKWNREQQMFNLTRDGFAMVAMGFTGAKAFAWKIEFLNAFNEMEAKLTRSFIKTKKFEQLNLFPGLQETVDTSRPVISVSGASMVIAYQRLIIPATSGKVLRGLVKRGVIEGFFDGRYWQMYQDSFDAWLRNRERGVAKAA